MTREETPRRSYDYIKDEDKLEGKKEATAYLLSEQFGLCAYCQSELKLETASIEHVIPKSFAPEISTNYHNLVAVCKAPKTYKENGRTLSHCDKQRGNLLIPSIIFYRNATIHLDTTKGKDKGIWKKNEYFEARADGWIVCNHEFLSNQIPAHKAVVGDQAKAFIEILNLNHPGLVANRKPTIEALLNGKPTISSNPSDYYRSRFQSYYRDRKKPNREFVLMYLFQKPLTSPNDQDWLQRFLSSEPI